MPTESGECPLSPCGRGWRERMQAPGEGAYFARSFARHPSPTSASLTLGFGTLARKASKEDD
jgi:hypothetical protein